MVEHCKALSLVLFDDILVLTSLTQMPLGFGNAIVLQTMFSQFYIGARVMIADFCFVFSSFSRPSFSFARIADGCWNGFCSIAKRFRFVETK
jgi:hypothetical protein